MEWLAHSNTISAAYLLQRRRCGGGGVGEWSQISVMAALHLAKLLLQLCHSAC